MTHFTVLVVGPDHEKQLEPYWELDLSPEDKKNDPRAVFNVEIKKDDLENEYKQWKATHNENNYKNIDEWLSEWFGYSKDENGDCGYYSNPNAKWDWWQVGGRWRGFFKLKNGKTGKRGEAGTGEWLKKNAELLGIDKDKIKIGEHPPENVDVAYKRDIDVDGMRNKQGKQYAKRWDIVHKNVRNLEITTWKQFLEKRDTDGITIDEARNLYHAQMGVIEFKRVKELYKDTFGWGASLDDYIVSRDEYIRRGRDSALTTSAILKDGKWYERGKVGWWATCNTDLTWDQWTQKWNEYFDELPDDVLLTIVDCHI
jgi:hypothetical protein